ncbi:hypothetical protein PTKIN_Ptkin11bG0038900 [Pterospermum kingtungense]
MLVVWLCWMEFPQLWSAKLAVALMEAMKWISSLGLKNNVIFALDTKIVACAMKSAGEDYTEFRGIIEWCRQFLQQEPSYD